MIAMESYRADLRRIVSAVYGELTAAVTPEARAYAALLVGPDIQPWTSEAEEIWRAEGSDDVWREHDLAVALHARAYDLEADRSDDAPEYWREALRRWGAVRDDDRFWERLREDLAERYGLALDPEVVGAVRGRLAHDLLAVHRSLVETYRPADRECARTHMQILKDAPFDRDLIEELRSRIVQPAIDSAMQAIPTAEFERAVRDLEDWLFIDSGNTALVRALVYVLRNWNPHLFNAREYEAVRANVRLADSALKQLPSDATAPGGAQAPERARVHYWRGLVDIFQALDLFDPEAPQGVLSRASGLLESGAEQMRAATAHDPGLEGDPFYGDVRRLEAKARAEHAKILLVLAQRTGGPPPNRAVDELRAAAEIEPEDQDVLAHLAYALLYRPNCSPDELNEAERVLDRASRLPFVDEGLREFVDGQRAMLDMWRQQ